MTRGKAAIAATLGLVIAGVLVSAAGAAPRDLSGEWVVYRDPGSAFTLRASHDRTTLTADWNGNPFGAHRSLVGHFTGTLNASGTAYTGPMHVSEGSVSSGGTMTMAISSVMQNTYPELNVSYSQDNGVSGSFTLELEFLPPEPIKDGVNMRFECPGPNACPGSAQALGAGGAGSADTGGGHAAAAKQVVLGTTAFKVKAGHRRTILVKLNTKGRNLLAKHGTLRVRVVLHMKSSSGLPPVQKAGTVTLHK